MLIYVHRDYDYQGRGAQDGYLSVDLRPQRLRQPRTGSPGRLPQCWFTSTETTTTKDGEPRTATSVLIYVHRDYDYQGRGAQDGYLSVDLRPQRLRLPRTGSPGRLPQCWFTSTETTTTSTETVTTIRDAEPRTATSVLIYVHRDYDYQGRGAQDGYLSVDLRPQRLRQPRTGSPGRQSRLSHSSQALSGLYGQIFIYYYINTCWALL